MAELDAALVLLSLGQRGSPLTSTTIHHGYEKQHTYQPPPNGAVRTIPTLPTLNNYTASSDYYVTPTYDYYHYDNSNGHNSSSGRGLSLSPTSPGVKPVTSYETLSEKTSNDSLNSNGQLNSSSSTCSSSSYYSKHNLLNQLPEELSTPYTKEGSRHIIHVGSNVSKKPYACKNCGRAFARREHLYRHIETMHNNQKDFKCTVCSRVFSRKDNMMQHVRNKHGAKK